MIYILPDKKQIIIYNIKIVQKKLIDDQTKDSKFNSNILVSNVY